MNFLCGYRIKEYKNSTVSKGFIFGVCVCKGFYELLFICIAQKFTIFLKIGLHFLNNSRYFPHKEIVFLKHYIKCTGKGRNSVSNIVKMKRDKTPDHE